ncbi:tRNA pseudouridine(55) synthase TruB [Reichenbachiella carrageenanivorans]|uniref:tRNA pseudouridine synthase B n=1 Tax=Reichenbachiella carrageenanivorans TaxID=2979869 RepID=A0ABY6D1Q5_9BACT|nr:tRNA pseudouridine(55) synthase TruB [Reichenbachiella carrageenanivorans]UXX80092.1 tRNA pseudouridine(55) synthase TruB [Reichenbachiella carrageenanivorans]
MDFEKGEVFLIDKPLEWTSFDVVKKIRGKLKIKKVGHAGTLDPLATGLLIVCAGRSTKKINEYQDLGKTYTGKMVLGKTTPSVDLETEFDSEKPYDHITPGQVEEAATQWTGDIMQVPPIYSAIKVDGERVYKAARRKEEVKLNPRPVQVSLFEVDTSQLPEISFKIQCSKGTYIRSLVRDVGEALGCGAYMSELRRTAIGDFQVEDAFVLDDFISRLQRD